MDLNSLGMFGDSFNVLTSLFTGLAFAGVVISVILQTKELEEARTEFRGQKEALIDQQKEMKIQSFDNKFFQMLNLFNNNINSLIINSNRETYKGRDLFVYLKFNLEKKIESRYLLSNKNSFEIVDFHCFIDSFKEFNNDNDTTFKYYFLNLYQIINYIDKDIPNKEYAKKYMNILRAQLSKSELILLCYNAIGVIEFSGDKYKKLIEKYSFFEHLQYEDFGENFNIIRINDILLSKYSNEAYGKNIQLIDKINTRRNLNEL